MRAYCATFLKPNRHISRNCMISGFSLIEVLIAAFILALIILSSLQMTNFSINGMGRSRQRIEVDTAIAKRVEKLRYLAFTYLCIQGCTDTSQSILFDQTELQVHCQNNTLGEGFLDSLPEAEKAADFTVQTTPPVAISAIFIAEGNGLSVTYSAPSLQTTIRTTLVPQAQGWCE